MTLTQSDHLQALVACLQEPDHTPAKVSHANTVPALAPTCRPGPLVEGPETPMKKTKNDRISFATSASSLGSVALRFASIGTQIRISVHGIGGIAVPHTDTPRASRRNRHPVPVGPGVGLHGVIAPFEVLDSTSHSLGHAKP